MIDSFLERVKSTAALSSCKQLGKMIGRPWVRWWKGQKDLERPPSPLSWMGWTQITTPAACWSHWRLSLSGILQDPLWPVESRRFQGRWGVRNAQRNTCTSSARPLQVSWRPLVLRNSREKKKKIFRPTPGVLFMLALDLPGGFFLYLTTVF